jgi:hypothetical protein
MVRLKKKARNRKRGRKGAVYVTKPQGRPLLRVGKGMLRVTKFT